MSKILVIEDEYDLRDGLLDTLRLAGYQVLGAGNGSDALAILDQELPHLIICDVLMPQMNGYEVLQLVRDDPATADIPFIFITAKAAPEEIQEGLARGANDYLTKPFTPRDLLAKIKALIEQ